MVVGSDHEAVPTGGEDYEAGRRIRTARGEGRQV